MTRYLFLLLLLSLTSVIHADEKSYFLLEQEGRTKDGEPYYEHTDISYSYNLTKKWTPFAAYRFIYEDKGGKTGYRFASRFMLGTHYTEKGEWGKFALRTRFEFIPGHELGDLNVANDYRVRERFKYDLPYSWTRFKLTPFVYDEIFFDLDSGFDFNRNRAGAGIGYTITKHIYGDIYYFHETKLSGSRWVDADIAALIIRYKF